MAACAFISLVREDQMSTVAKARVEHSEARLHRTLAIARHVRQQAAVDPRAGSVQPCQLFGHNAARLLVLHKVIRRKVV